MKQDAFRDLTLAGKLFDFVAMRKPVVVSSTRSVRETFGEGCFELFASGDPVDLARAIRRIHDDPRRSAAYVVGGVGAVSLGLGGVFGAISLSHANALKTRERDGSGAVTTFTQRDAVLLELQQRRDRPAGPCRAA